MYVSELHIFTSQDNRKRNKEGENAEKKVISNGGTGNGKGENAG